MQQVAQDLLAALQRGAAAQRGQGGFGGGWRAGQLDGGGGFGAGAPVGQHRLGFQQAAPHQALGSRPPIHPPDIAVYLPAAQRAVLFQQLEQADLQLAQRWPGSMGGRAGGIARVGLLAEAGRQHQGQAGRQGRQRLLGQSLGQGHLGGGQHGFFIHQRQQRARFGHLRLADKAEHHPLHPLAAKWGLHQVARLHQPLKLWRQVVVESSTHLRNIDGDLDVDGHVSEQPRCLLLDPL